MRARVADLAARAAHAEQAGDPVGASAVLNLAALIASDCDAPEQARLWCHRHAQIHLTATPLDDRDTRHALEPLVNLARLHLRAGDGAAARGLIENLHAVVSTSTAASIDGTLVPADLVRGAATSTQRWLWTVRLAVTARSLVLQQHWDEAVTTLTTLRGIGHRMLDGRQVAVLASIAQGNHAGTHDLLRTTTSGETWENQVTATLGLLAAGAQSLGADGSSLMAVNLGGLADDSRDSDLLFRTRLTLSLIDGLHVVGAPALFGRASEVLRPDPGSTILRSVIARVVADGDAHAAREILDHLGHGAVLSSSEVRLLAAQVAAAGLDQISFQRVSDELAVVVDRAGATLARALHERGWPRSGANE